MANMVRLGTVILICVLVVVPLANATFVQYDYRDDFYYACRDYIQTGNGCALMDACCPMINTIASQVSKSSTQDEQSYACLSMKAALYDMPNYNYNNTKDMVARCGVTLPFNVAKSAPCY
ncbi:Non-specific lipid-transfer protein 1-like protein [Drosera capensis]